MRSLLLKAPLLNSYGFKAFRKEQNYSGDLDRDRRFSHKTFYIASIDNYVNELMLNLGSLKRQRFISCLTEWYLGILLSHWHCPSSDTQADPRPYWVFHSDFKPQSHSWSAVGAVPYMPDRRELGQWWKAPRAITLFCVLTIHKNQFNFH